MLEESLERLNLLEWANHTLTDEQMRRLQELLDEAGGVNDISQARFLFELTRLTQTTEPELARLLSERALEAAEDPDAWLDGSGLMSRYWGYEAFLETHTELRIGGEDERERFFEIAERQVDLAPEVAERLRRYNNGLEHAGYYHLADRAASNGDTSQALELVRRAQDEGWRGNWDQLEQRYESGSE